MRNRKDGYKCDWCGMHYPLVGWDYYQIEVHSRRTHRFMLRTICSDCYKRLKHITVEMQIKEREKKENAGE